MNRWTISLLGLVAFAALFWFCVPKNAEKIQASIAESLGHTMGRGARKNVGFVVDGRYVTLTGTVETEKAKAKAAFFASRPRLVASVDNQIKVVPPTPPASN